MFLGGQATEPQELIGQMLEGGITTGGGGITPSSNLLFGFSEPKKTIQVLSAQLMGNPSK